MKINCPKCDKVLQTVENTDQLDKCRSNLRHFPFCSERCKMGDLNAWLDAEYKIPTSDTDGDDYPFENSNES